jgi:hypothetical protein
MRGLRCLRLLGHAAQYGAAVPGDHLAGAYANGSGGIHAMGGRSTAPLGLAGAPLRRGDGTPRGWHWMPRRAWGRRVGWRSPTTSAGRRSVGTRDRWSTSSARVVLSTLGVAGGEKGARVWPPRSDWSVPHRPAPPTRARRIRSQARPPRGPGGWDDARRRCAATAGRRPRRGPRVDAGAPGGSHASAPMPSCGPTRPRFSADVPRRRELTPRPRLGAMPPIRASGATGCTG